MEHEKRIVGNKVYLSPIIEQDLDKYYVWMNNSYIINNIGRSDKITSEFSNKEWFDKTLKDEKYVLSIINNADNSLIGCCGFNDVNFVHRTCEIYIYIGEDDARGKGFGKESLNLMIEYAFNILNMHSVFIKVFEFNNVALNLYKSVGFKVIGRRRKNYYLNGKYYDTIYLDILNDEYIKD